MGIQDSSWPNRHDGQFTPQDNSTVSEWKVGSMPPMEGQSITEVHLW